MIRMTAPRTASSDTQVESDAELLARVASGEIGALGAIYDRHQAALRRFLAHATSNAADVDDLVHTTLLTAAQSAARYDGRLQCRPWLFGIAEQLLRRRRYSLARWLKALSAFAGSRPQSIDPRAALQARRDVWRALQTLSEAKRITLLLSEVEGLSGEEISAILGIPLGTVWTRLHAARRELRAQLEGHGLEGDDS